jgi:hypothetical protein
MYRFFFRFVVATLTILTANLLTNTISDFLVSHKNQYKPITFTLIGMAIIIIVFYPLFMKLEDWIKEFSVKVIKSGNSFAGKYLGLFLTFLVGLFILVYFYARMWYSIDFLQVILHGNIGGYL